MERLRVEVANLTKKKEENEEELARYENAERVIREKANYLEKESQ